MIEIEYRFRLAEDAATFRLRFDPATMALVEPAAPPPDWARLDCYRCPHCPLDAAQAHCPMASALAPLLSFAGRVVSFDEVDLAVVLPERTVIARVSAQRAIGSLMGLLMATCDCPHTHFLRPMARFHLPLASEIETVYRAVGAYLLEQYFLARQGHRADLELAGLKARYAALHAINLSMAARLRAASSQDASVNAVILLDCFARALPAEIDDALPELETLFAGHLRAA